MRDRRHWLRIHGGIETRFAAAVRRFFDGQADRILEALREFNHPTSAIVPQLLDLEREHQKFMGAVRPFLAGAMQVGALDSLQRAERKAFDPAADPFTANIPPEFQSQMRGFLKELEAQTFWKDVQKDSQKKLIRVIDQGWEDGLTERQMAKRIYAAMGGKASKERALRIARTETTGMANAGNYAAGEQLAADGILKSRQWLPIIDKTTRKTHMLMDGEVAAVGALFVVGGFECRFPGDWWLPAQERVNCRCVALDNLNY